MSPLRRRLSGDGGRSWTDLRWKRSLMKSYFQMSSQVNIMSCVLYVVHAPCVILSIARACLGGLCPPNFCLDHGAPLFLVCSAPQKCLCCSNPLTFDNRQFHNVSLLEQVLCLTDILCSRLYPAGGGNNACYSDLLICGVFKCEYKSRVSCLEFLCQ
ncbi:hypothetical protein DPMN_029654 [Dreissena polymorpha]|uniref:Uncharacterized protein n=1 Tax=Dreissena polymorpha TaxID=45954 RepID=A0A9D4LYJ2_DREPO|nr:hypothetical protein DPMN_029654 [Dreissena polymorpha]